MSLEDLANLVAIVLGILTIGKLIKDWDKE